MFALYLEPLPRSLFCGLKSTLQLSDAYTILYNISSALAYLTALPVIHNDIKPLNITYSPHRGAVLIDFGMATATDSEKIGGSSWYLPPDVIDDNTRGSPGDIWALGITMLYVLGKIDFPERSVKGWTIHDLYRPGESRRRMTNWLSFISGIRAKLNHMPDKGDTRDRIEYIVFKMLEVDGTLRIKAKNITSALDEIDPVGHVADSAEDGGSSIQPKRR
jgi:serine/threonine protein kinase